MGERRESGPHCSRCGARCDRGGGCPSCDRQTSGAPVQLVALPGDDAPPPPDDVLLVREIKGTAVRDPAPAAALRELPGAPARSAAEGAGEVTNVLCGPGFRRRRSVPWRWLVWILALAAGLLLWR